MTSSPQRTTTTTQAQMKTTRALPLHDPLRSRRRQRLHPRPAAHLETILGLRQSRRVRHQERRNHPPTRPIMVCPMALILLSRSQSPIHPSFAKTKPCDKTVGMAGDARVSPCAVSVPARSATVSSPYHIQISLHPNSINTFPRTCPIRYG